MTDDKNRTDGTYADDMPLQLRWKGMSEWNALGRLAGLFLLGCAALLVAAAILFN